MKLGYTCNGSMFRVKILSLKRVSSLFAHKTG